LLGIHERIKILEADLLAEPMRISAYHDLPFTVFHYSPEEEYMMRREIELLATRLGNHGRKVTCISLAELLWIAVERTEGIDSLVQEEKNFGYEIAEKTLATILTDERLCPLHSLVLERMKRLDPARDIVFLFRAGALAPAVYQLSQLFGHMQGQTEVPVILFYPGSVEGATGLKFMDLPDRSPMGSYRVKIY
jgi:hypothetical protein